MLSQSLRKILFLVVPVRSKVRYSAVDLLLLRALLPSPPRHPAFDDFDDFDELDDFEREGVRV